MADESIGEVKSGGDAASDTISKDPYPEVSGDESGIVPPQNARNPEWPKKIRTLTAAELDRLTIDSSGRFYWDGKLVNYETRTSATGDHTPVSLEHSLDMLERAANEFGDRKVPAPIEGAQLPRPIADSDLHHDHAANLAEALAIPQVIRSTEQVRLTLTGLQSFGLTLAIIGLVLGACGVAASGFVAAHGWSCRTGLIRHTCPAPPRPPLRADIPA
jgi:hypothetical protein